LLPLVLILVLVPPSAVCSPIASFPPVSVGSSPVLGRIRVVKTSSPSIVAILVIFVIEFVPGRVASSSYHGLDGFGEGESSFDDIVALDDDVDLDSW